MSSDKVIAQTEADALVSKVPQKPGLPPVTNSAQTEYDSLAARLARLESNYAIMKKELQAIMLDIREKSLEEENPFNASSVPGTSQADTRRTETHSE